MCVCVCVSLLVCLGMVVCVYPEGSRCEGAVVEMSEVPRGWDMPHPSATACLKGYTSGDGQTERGTERKRERG